LRIRQWAKQDRVNDAEDGGVRADAERERDDRDDGESGILEKLSNGEAKITHGIADC
jgi:hypothetical protein